MDNKEKLTRKIIELIHGLPYEKAVMIDTVEIRRRDGHDHVEYTGIKPITIGRIMEAIGDGYALFTEEGRTEVCAVRFVKSWELEHLTYWKIVRDNGQECTLEDQSKKTIEALYKLLNNHEE